MRLPKAVAVVAFAALFASCGAMEERIKRNGDDQNAQENTQDGPTEPSDVVDNPAAPDSSATAGGNTAGNTTNGGNASIVGKKFYIVAGSFKDLENAKRLNRILVQKGAGSELLPEYNEFTRVVIASFDNEQDARVALNKYRAERNDRSIWLLASE